MANSIDILQILLARVMIHYETHGLIWTIKQTKYRDVSKRECTYIGTKPIERAKKLNTCKD